MMVPFKTTCADHTGHGGAWMLEWDGEKFVKASDLLEENTPRLIDLCQREAGKTLMDGVLEVREAVDFLRYYACEEDLSHEAPDTPLPPSERRFSKRVTVRPARAR